MRNEEKRQDLQEKKESVRESFHTSALGMGAISVSILGFVFFLYLVTVLVRFLFVLGG